MYVDLLTLCSLYSASSWKGNTELMGIGSGSLDGNGNDVRRNPGIIWEMGMQVWEWGVMGT